MLLFGLNFDLSLFRNYIVELVKKKVINNHDIKKSRRDEITIQTIYSCRLKYKFV